MAFSAPLTVTQIGPGKWVVEEPFIYSKGLFYIEVPVGYVTDFASVPRPFRWLIPKSGEYNQAAVLHDYLYTDLNRKYTKETADALFYVAMVDLDVPIWKRKLMLFAVKVFGPRHYWKAK